ncbi:hypothetical protein [Nocardia pseudovaccinii]|uniref:hypothetical protein n=1 Tax=Nocardia pseudovaccinii TaxID=189540 RepID=UPI0007A3736B|nr:hypothetical protein [Nocardia pseudovaccinii]
MSERSDRTTDTRENLLWVPDACTLPTAEQPLRVAEFTDLFAAALRRVERIAPTRLRLELAASHEGTARDLAASESSCCGFFDFDFATAGPDAIAMDIEVPASRVDVLETLANHATAAQSK